MYFQKTPPMAQNMDRSITKDNFRTKISFGVNLVDASLKHINFLYAVDERPYLYMDTVLVDAVRRYEQCWLPLAAENNEKVLAAPMDIEWVWHCHMLSPLTYEKDCLATVGVTVNHKLMSEKERERSLETSKQVWTTKYPNEPFDLDKNKCFTSGSVVATGERTTQISYDIVAAAKRQKVFNYQVSLPHYADRLYLKKATERYQKMLFLKQKNPGVFLVPCYDMDIVWHSHQLHPLAYKEDTVKILGRMFNHDDSVNDRSQGSKLNRSDDRTRQLWLDAFNENFSHYGAMFRGDPPSGLHPISNEESFSFSTKKANIHMDKMQVEGLPNEMKNFKIKVHFVASEKEGPSITTFKGPGREWKKKSVQPFCFDTKLYNCIKFKIIHTVAMLLPMCFSSSEQIAQNVFHMLPVVENNEQENSTISETVILDEEQNIKVTFTADIKVNPKSGPCVLFLRNGNYEPRFCIMPEHIKQMWGPIPLPRLPTGHDNHCLVATHK